MLILAASFALADNAVPSVPWCSPDEAAASKHATALNALWPDNAVEVDVCDAGADGLSYDGETLSMQWDGREWSEQTTELVLAVALARSWVRQIDVSDAGTVPAPAATIPLAIPANTPPPPVVAPPTPPPSVHGAPARGVPAPRPPAPGDLEADDGLAQMDEPVEEDMDADAVAPEAESEREIRRPSDRRRWSTVGLAVGTNPGAMGIEGRLRLDRLMGRMRWLGQPSSSGTQVSTLDLTYGIFKWLHLGMYAQYQGPVGGYDYTGDFTGIPQGGIWTGFEISGKADFKKWGVALTGRQLQPIMGLDTGGNPLEVASIAPATHVVFEGWLTINRVFVGLEAGTEFIQLSEGGEMAVPRAIWTVGIAL